MAFFIWSFRILVYCAAVWVSFSFIAPHFGSMGPYIAGPAASLAIIGDLLLSSKMKKTSVASEVAGRIAIADRIAERIGGGKTLEAPKHEQLENRPKREIEAANRNDQDTSV